MPPSPGTGICDHDDNDDDDYHYGDYGVDGDVEYPPRQDEPPSDRAQPSLG